MLIFLMRFVLGGSDRQTWIDMCQKAAVDPREIVDKYLDRLLKLVLDANVAKSQVPFLSASSTCSGIDKEIGWLRGRELQCCHNTRIYLSFCASTNHSAIAARPRSRSPQRFVRRRPLYLGHA